MVFMNFLSMKGKDAEALINYNQLCNDVKNTSINVIA